MTTIFRPIWLCVIPIVIAASGCQSPKSADVVSAPTTSDLASGPSGDGVAMLKAAMTRYQALKSFSAKCEWKMAAGKLPGDMSTSKRHIYYEAPNKYHVYSEMTNGLRQDTVSDGLKTLEWSNSTPGPANVIQYPSPVSFDKANSMQMLHPMFCGSLLYQFFAGPNGIDALVDSSKGPITKSKASETREGEPAYTLSFYATRQFGHTKAVIGEKTGKVYEISYDAEPLVEMLKKTSGSNAAGVTSFQTTEVYSHIQFDKALTPEQLSAKPPSGSKITPVPQETDAPKGPKIGAQAPDFSVMPVSGGSPVKLSSFRGKYVFIDFWATWCPPCREGLPHTEALFKDFKAKNLVVMAISGEEPDTISKFWKEARYTMPVYTDPDNKAAQAYAVDAIPETLLIDPQGKIAYAQIGGVPEEQLRADLAKVGLK